MQSFTINELELLTGINASTLRIWEHRYDFTTPQFKKGPQRFFSNEAIKRLLSIAFFYNNGWKAAKIATLSNEEIDNEVEKLTLNLTVVNYKTYLQLLLQAAIDFNESSFIQLLNNLKEVLDFERLITEIYDRYLQISIQLWHSGEAASAHHYFTNYIFRNLIIAETDKYLNAQTGNPQLLLFSPQKDDQRLSLLFINYLLRKHGWRVLYLGTGVTLRNLKEIEGIDDVAMLYVHLSRNTNGLSVDEYFEQLLYQFPNKKIVASGKLLEQSQRNFLRITLLKRDEEIYRFIEKGPGYLGNT